MKKYIYKGSIFILLVGIGLMILSSYRIKEAQLEMENTLKIWDYQAPSLIESQTVQETPSSGNTVSVSESKLIYSDNDLIGKLLFKSSAIPILTGTDESLLDQGVLHYSTTPFPGTMGNSIILGHRDGAFKTLKELNMNDSFEIEMHHKVFTYEVIDIKILTPEDLSVFDSYGFPTVSLETCYPFSYFGPAPKRYIVVGKKVEQTQN